MTDEEFGYRVVVEDLPQGGASTVRFRDTFLNYAFSDQVKERVQALVRLRLDRGVRQFVVDLTAVNVMDSCGMSVLIGMRKLADARQGRMVFVATSPILLRLFAITRLDGVFEIYRDEPAAIGALTQPPPSRPSAPPAAALAAH